MEQKPFRPSKTGSSDGRRPSGQQCLLVEGWRGVNHSYGLINQHQLLQMRNLSYLHLYHRDLPLYSERWNARDNDSGFNTEEITFLKTVPPPPSDASPDGVYRICTPFLLRGPSPRFSCPNTIFIVTEVGLSPDHFADGAGQPDLLDKNDDQIVTPTSWSRDRLIDWGFDPALIHIVPLGVDSQTFKPVAKEVRNAARMRLNIHEDEIMFLNIGAPLSTKGTDLLLRAFAVLRLRGLPVRLVVKDQSNVYGIQLAAVLQTIGKNESTLLRQEVLDGITAIPVNLKPSELTNLFGAADCYVSPYRAEGFNLPVLEAIACSIPTIVTLGGATDEFCDDDTSLRVPGRFCRWNGEDGVVGAYISPDLDALIAAMTRFVLGGRPDAMRFEAARRRILARFNWHDSTAQTVRLALRQ